MRTLYFLKYRVKSVDHQSTWIVILSEIIFKDIKVSVIISVNGEIIGCSILLLLLFLGQDGVESPWK